MADVDPLQVLLALDAGVRETGWALFSPSHQVTTGVIGIPGRRGMSVPDRLRHLIEGLDRLVEQWRPNTVVHSLPSGIHWPVPALQLLTGALQEWCQRCQLHLVAYSAQEVRTGLTGRANASREDLSYAVMLSLELIGQHKTTHEWEAVAVGHYHLSRHHGGNGTDPPH